MTRFFSLSVLIGLLLIASACDSEKPGSSSGASPQAGNPSPQAGSPQAGSPQAGNPSPQAGSAASSSTAMSDGPYTCTMHPEIVQAGPGACTLCPMDLVKQHDVGAFVCLEHLDSVDVRKGPCTACSKPRVAVERRKVYSCLVHPQIVLNSAGECPICKSMLLTLSAGEIWVCARNLVTAASKSRFRRPQSIHLGANETLEFTPHMIAVSEGKCRECQDPLVLTTFLLPHGDHKPKHSGIFFMAPDNWHHVEGTFYSEEKFRIYFYDNFTRPMPASKFSGYLILGEIQEDGTLVDSDEHVVLEMIEEEYLECSLPGRKPPFYCSAVVRLGDNEESFDFGFLRWSDEGPPLPGESPRPGSTVDPSLVPKPREIEIPESSEGILTAIRERAETIDKMVREARWTEIYAPAFDAKDLALALESRESAENATRPADRSLRVKDVVRGAWLLDLHGDAGSREKVLEAHAVFKRGVEGLLGDAAE